MHAHALAGDDVGSGWPASSTPATRLLRVDNALLRIDDLEAAGERCERFAHRAWPTARRPGPAVNIHLPAIGAAEFCSYYWCLDPAVVATDVMF